MRIEIKTKLRPFSHKSGTACLIPGTTRVVRAYPTRIEVEGLGHIETTTRPFTLTQDLERGLVRVGKTKIIPLANGVKVGDQILGSGEPLSLSPTENLSFGCAKKQDWDLILRRLDPREIYPIWFRLGQLIPAVGEPIDNLLETLQGRFSDLMVPTTKELHTGFDLPNVEPITLLNAGYKTIRSYFIQEDDQLALLPNLPPELHAGRMTNVKFSHGTLDLEWSKKSLRRVIIRLDKPWEPRLRLQSHLKHYRTRQKAGVLFLDRFTK